MIDMNYWKCECRFKYIHRITDSICIKCGKKKENNAKSHEVEERNMFVERDIFRGTYSREALVGLVKEAFGIDEVVLDVPDRWLVDLADRLINGGKQVDIYSFIVESLN